MFIFKKQTLLDYNLIAVWYFDITAGHFSCNYNEGEGGKGGKNNQMRDTDQILPLARA